VVSHSSAKAAATWVVLNAWASYPEHPATHHWHIELGPLAEWLAAVARTAKYQMPSYVRTDLSNVVAKVRFTTADGVRWETPTKGEGSGEPTRL
jgi:hypothetical protein